MNLTCKRCGAEITADNINLDRMIAIWSAVILSEASR
jgi:hypothetical protein